MNTLFTSAVDLTPAEFALTSEKIAKINTRAAKRGFTGRFELKYERIVTKRQISIGLEIEEIKYRTEITGIAPSYNGWKFIARVDAIGDEFTLASVPGVTDIDRSAIKPNFCDHCSTTRYRKATYLVQNEETGETKNVGSTCIKDFLGWDASFSFISTEDVSEELFGSACNQDPTYTVETILATATVAIKAFGFVSVSRCREDQIPTKAHVGMILRDDFRTKEDLATYGPLTKLVPEAISKTDAIIDWIKSLDDQSEFTHNLKACVNAGEVTTRQIGILTYAPEGYARSIVKAVEKEQINKISATSEFIGGLGDKVEIVGTLQSIRYINGIYGTSTLYTVATERGLVKWFASSDVLGDEINRPIKLKGTVKKLGTYNDVKSTILTRCKEIAA